MTNAHPSGCHLESTDASTAIFYLDGKMTADTLPAAKGWLNMGKLIYSAITSLDSYIADEEGNFDFPPAAILRRGYTSQG